MSGWQDRAACRGTGHVLFFGEEYERGPDRARREKNARALCATCPVRPDCLDYAIERGMRWGLWGGMDEAERKKEKQRRESEAA